MTQTDTAAQPEAVNAEPETDTVRVHPLIIVQGCGQHQETQLIQTLTARMFQAAAEGEEMQTIRVYRQEDGALTVAVEDAEPETITIDLKVDASAAQEYVDSVWEKVQKLAVPLTLGLLDSLWAICRAGGQSGPVTAGAVVKMLSTGPVDKLYPPEEFDPLFAVLQEMGLIRPTTPPEGGPYTEEGWFNFTSTAIVLLGVIETIARSPKLAVSLNDMMRTEEIRDMPFGVVTDSLDDLVIQGLLECPEPGFYKLP